MSLVSNAQIGEREPSRRCRLPSRSGNLITLDESRLHAEVIFLRAIGGASRDSARPRSCQRLGEVLSSTNK